MITFSEDKQYENEVTVDEIKHKASKSSLQNRTIDCSVKDDINSENPSLNNRLDHTNIPKISTNDKHYKTIRNSNVEGSLIKKNGDLAYSYFSYNTKHKNDRFVVFSGSENESPASSSSYAYLGKHGSKRIHAKSFLCQNSLNHNQKNFPESDKKIYVETPLVSQNLTRSQTETRLMAVKAADNQLIIYECNCTRCTQFHELPQRNLTARGAAETKNKSHLKKFLKKDCLIPEKKKSVASDTSYR